MSEKQPQTVEKEANGKPVGKKALLFDYVNKKVSVITNDGRNVIGNLLGFDQVCNVVLDKSTERIFAPDAAVQVVNLGLYVIRGDNIAVLGEVNLEKDATIAWDKIKHTNRMFTPASSIPLNLVAPLTKTKGHPINRVIH